MDDGLALSHKLLFSLIYGLVVLQRYFANPDNYQEGGPIFIYVGGDYEVGTYWLEHGHMHDIAVDLNGFVFGSEMRFFGRNHPTSDVSTDNLRFLTTEQVLADLAFMIDHIKQEDPRLTDARVILVGTAFGANVATWFRARYPAHSDGVWSSSSYVEARMNYAEYFEMIGNDINTFGSFGCYRRIWRAFRTIQNLIEASRSQVLDDLFHLCHPLNASSTLEVQHFYEEVAGAIAIATIGGGFNYVFDLCDSLTNADTSNDLIAFADWFSLEHRGGPCFEQSFQEVVDFHSETDWSALGVLTGRRQYQYLACTEYGWFATTDSDNQPFGNQIDAAYYVELCRQIFGDWMTDEAIRNGTESFNLSFGGTQPDITNAFFTNGELDPHRLLNVQDDIGATVEARLLPRKSPSKTKLAMSR